MQLEKFTVKAQEALQSSRDVAFKRSHQEVDGEHLLSALLAQSESLVPALLQRLGVSLDKLTPELERELSRRVTVQGISSADVFYGSALKKTLDAADS